MQQIRQFESFDWREYEISRGLRGCLKAQVKNFIIERKRDKENIRDDDKEEDVENKRDDKEGDKEGEERLNAFANATFLMQFS